MKINRFLLKKFSIKKIYTKPLDMNQILTVIPAKFVPKEIIRPIYVTKKNYEPSYKEISIIKAEELNNFKIACNIAAGAVEAALDSFKKGLSKTTEDVDTIVHEYIISRGAYPSAIGYLGFPKSVCTSVNEVACHGIPNGRHFENGDYINIDVTAYYGGFHGDTSGMAWYGDIHPDINKLVLI